MGVASKFLMLLSTPFPLLYPSRYAVGLARHSRLALAVSLPTAPSPPCNYAPLPVCPHRQRSSFSPRAAEEFHTGATDRVDYEQLPQTAETVTAWPEWSRFVEHVITGVDGSKRSFLSAIAVSEGDDDDSFVASCDLPDDFARAAEACLAFARERPVLLKLLSKKNIMVLVDNGSPFLFNNGPNSTRRMTRHLSDEGFSLSGTETAQTIDLMRYLLSYIYSQLVSSKLGSFSATEIVETSVNDLLNDMVRTSSPVGESPVTISSLSSEQFSGPRSHKIETRRGDWICPKCSYMNFARNVKCLKCDEGRPNRQLTGGEWECPQCDFFNYGRNMACLRCDCKRPVFASHESNLGYKREPSLEQIRSQDAAITSGVAWPLLDKDKRAERRVDKVAEPINSSVLGGVIADKDFSEIMPQKQSSVLANTTKHSGPPAEGRGRFSVNITDKGLDSSITRSLEKILDQSSPTSGSVSTSQNNNNASAPFAPLPPGVFRNHQSSSIHEKHLENRWSSAKGELQNVPSMRSRDGHPGRAPHYESSHNFNDDREMFNSSNNTLENYGKQQTASVSNDDFPEIMPMRKGENRFVVSRKKDRSLTSPQYKRRLAMEQAGGSNFVPFVPFPPGYFARKDEAGGDGAPTSSETVSSASGKSDVAEAADPNAVAESEATQNTSKSWNSESFGRSPSVNSKIIPPAPGGFNSSLVNDGTWIKSEMRRTDVSQVGSSPVSAGNSNTLWNNNNYRTNYTRGVDSRSRESASREPKSSWNRNQENRNSGKDQTKDVTSADLYSDWNKNEQCSGNGYSSWNSSNNANTDEKSKTQSGKGSSWGFTGKSLEGSAVPEEPDPLDMSEEAKAQRWFRRVAQITDISQLSNIPDEDFPEIMPMRKGVNRFVVSKRKTPLERRLTSPQYRRNLPIVSSDPEKDSNKQV